VTEKLLPTAPTTVSVSELYAAIRRIWTLVVPEVSSSRPAIVLICAHSALETGFWHACWCWNLGNFKHVRGDGHDYYALKHDEIVNGKTVWLDTDPSVAPTDPFIAFATLDASVTYYLEQLRTRWRAAWPFLVDGAAAAFCHALKIAGYYTAPEAVYTAGVLRCMRQLDATIAPDTLPELPIVHADVQADDVTPDSELPPAVA
jgi:hypothetical protein